MTGPPLQGSEITITPEQAALVLDADVILKAGLTADTPLHLFGSDLFGDEVRQPSNSILGKRFLLPPFTVLNAREGWWQTRKAAWLSLGIKSELGRGEDATFTQGALNRIMGQKRDGALFKTTSAADPDFFRKLEEERRVRGLPDLTAEEFERRYYVRDDAGYESGTSVFDPVLCELCYAWWCPPEGVVLDPFAGGSVRGIVAARLRRRYVGIELSAAQCEANREQARRILIDNPHPLWLCGDSRAQLDEAPAADFIFSCPPYGDLEVYSDDPADLSAMEHKDFVAAYRFIIARAAERLRPDRFAAWVVGDYRGPDGTYRNFPGLTIDAFRAAGLALYNEAILVTQVGSLPIRVSAQFPVSRKLGKTHQNVFVFLKGDARRAAAACAPPEEE